MGRGACVVNMRMHFACAALLRALPAFPGKGRLAGALHDRLLACLPPSEAVRTVRMRDGSTMILDVRSHTEWYSFYTGQYEGLLAAVVDLVPPGSAVLDVGANVGFWTIPLARHLKGSGGKVVAFEPIAANHVRLKENIAANGLDDVVQALPVALGDRNGPVAMLFDDSYGATTGNAVVEPSPDLEIGQLERAHVNSTMRRLDDMAEDLCLEGRPCRFIKVDIEGTEPLFFRGASDFISRHRPAILAESNPPWLVCYDLRVSDYLTSLPPGAYSVRCWRRQVGRWENVDSFDDSFMEQGVLSVLFVPR